MVGSTKHISSIISNVRLRYNPKTQKLSWKQLEAINKWAQHMPQSFNVWAWITRYKISWI